MPDYHFGKELSTWVLYKYVKQVTNCDGMINIIEEMEKLSNFSVSNIVICLKTHLTL